MNKTKLISLLLALSMVFSMMVFPVAAVEENEGTTEDTEANAPVNPDGCPLHEDALWTEIGEADWGAGGALESGHYKLKETVTPSKALTVADGQTVCVDLAGFNITAPNTNNIRAIEIAAGGTLTVIDSIGTGVISGGKVTNNKTIDGEWTSSNYVYKRGGNIYNDGTFNLYGGTVSGGIANFGNAYCTSQGGNYYGSATSTLNMYGGAITGGQLTSTSYTLNSTLAAAGANIYSHGTVNIFGGTISGGKTVDSDTNTSAKRSMFCYGGNIAVVEGTLNISGGTIDGGQAFGIRTNTATYGQSAVGYGGNIYAIDSAVTISGGTISNGQAKSVANTVGTTSYAFMTGDCLGCGGNIYLAGGSFEMTGGIVSGGSAMLDITNSGDTTKDRKNFAYARGGNLFLSDVDATISGGTITGGAVSRVDDAELTTDDYGDAQGGSIYLTSSVTMEISGAANISGGSATSQGGNIYNNKTLNISGNAVITKGYAGVSGGNIFNAGTVNMTGGTVSDGSTVLGISGEGIGGNVQNGGTFNMSGGIVSGGMAYYRGGNFYNGSSCTLTLSGNAVVTGGTLDYDYNINNGISTTRYTASYGGNYYGGGILKMYDNAVIKDGVAYNGGNVHTATNGGQIYMYGGAIYGGRVANTGTNLRLYNHASVAFYMYGGYVEHLNDGGTSNVIQLYNGTFGADVSKVTTTDGANALMSCAHYTKLGNYYNVWHAEGACATCSHTYTEYGVGKNYTSTDTQHLTLGGAHTYADGACSVCGKAAPAHTAACSHGCENVTWTAWDGVTVEDGGHYYLTDNMAMSATIALVETSACLDLNGYTLTAPPAARAFTTTSNSSLALMDSSAANTGLLRSFSLPANMHGANLRASAGTSLYLYDLTVADGLTAGTGDSNRGGNIYAVGAGTVLEINNAKILNGSMVDAGGAQRGGNICVYQNATVIIKGEDALIADGVAYGEHGNCYGGNIHYGQGGYLYIYDGTIEGGVAKDGANISMVNGTEDAGQKGFMYMYGGTIGGNGNYANGKPCKASSLRVAQTIEYMSDVFVYGGEIHGDISASGSYGDFYIYAGTLEKNPTTLDNGASALADCACFSYDAQTGLYTVSHINTAETCTVCAGNDKGAAIGYSEPHIYTNVVTGIVAKAGGEGYTDLTTALDAAAHTAKTVTLITDVFVDGNVDIYCELDLNGKTLTATGVVDALNNSASIIDSVGTGTASGSSVEMMPENGMLAISAENDGVYTFETVDVVQKVEKVTDAEGQEVVGRENVKFFIDKAAAVTKLDDAIRNGDDIEIRITVKWGDNKSHSFTYTDDLVQQYLAKWDSKIFTCQIIGLDALGEYTICADIKANGVIVEAFDFQG